MGTGKFDTRAGFLLARRNRKLAHHTSPEGLSSRFLLRTLTEVILHTLPAFKITGRKRWSILRRLLWHSV